jgi:hypothetical protein
MIFKKEILLLFHVIVLRVILDNYIYGLFKKSGRYKRDYLD